MKRELRLISLLLTLLLTGCMREPLVRENRGGQPFPEGAPVTLNFTVEAEGMEDFATKALGEDSPLENFYVAVFGSSGYLKEYVKASLLSKNPEPYEYEDFSGRHRSVDAYTFSITLTLSDSPRILHFIGNGPSSLPFGYADAVLPSLLSDPGTGSYWQTKTVPGIRARKSETEYVDAHGETVFVGDYIDIDGNKIIDGHGYVPDDATTAAFAAIPMIRNWSKIVVTKDTSEDPVTHEINDPCFEPYSYAVVNAPSRGTIVPHCAATGFVSNYQNRSFDELENMGYTSNTPVGTPFDTSVPSAEDFINCTGKVSPASDGAVYLFERPVPSESLQPTHVILYGHYRNPDDLEHEGDYFYKVDLMVNSEYYPIFRNFKYQIVIRKILSQGHHTPEAAAAAAGSADVSADITTSHLSDISDGKGRLVIQPWMSRTFIDQQVDNQILHAYLMSDIYTETIEMEPDSVTVTALPMPYGDPDLITNLSIDPPSTEPGSVGWRTIHFSTTAPSQYVLSQTLRVTGYHKYGRLYRDVVITVQPIQQMKLVCSSRRLPSEKGAEQNISISIPDGLSESMFPLQFNIEAEDRTLSPDVSREGNNLPVAFSPSISEHENYAGKPSYHFVYTLSWEDYRSLSATIDDEDYVWRTFTCYFKTNCDESATTVWVENHYFYKESVRFVNYRSAMTFRDLNFTGSIPCAEDETVTVHFTVDMDPDKSYPEDFPIILLKARGMLPLSDELVPGPTSGTYVFKPTSATVDLDFSTITDDGDLALELSAEEYVPQTLKSHHFTNVGFIWGHKLTSGSQKMSNVIYDRVNSDNGKTLILGYCEDPDAPNTTVNVEGLSSLTAYQMTFPWTPGGPVSTTADPTYHELELQTTGGKSYNHATLTLTSPGYVSVSLSTGRLNGYIHTKEITAINVFKPSNTYGFTVDNPTFTMQMETASGRVHNMVVTFSNISAIRGSDPKGVVIPKGESCTITFEVTGRNDCYVCYIDFSVQNHVSWEGVRTNCDIASATPADGEFIPYRGNDYNYMWYLPQQKLSSSITLTAGDDAPIILKEMTLKTFKGVVYD